MFDRFIVGMKGLFSAVGFITLGLGGLGVMNIMLIAVKDRTSRSASARRSEPAAGKS